MCYGFSECLFEMSSITNIANCSVLCYHQSFTSNVLGTEDPRENKKKMKYCFDIRQCQKDILNVASLLFYAAT